MMRLPAHPASCTADPRGGALDAGDDGCRVAALLSSGQRIRTIDDDPDQGTLQIYRQLRRYVKGGGKHDETAIPERCCVHFRIGWCGAVRTILRLPWMANG